MKSVKTLFNGTIKRLALALTMITLAFVGLFSPNTLLEILDRDDDLNPKTNNRKHNVN